jgi:hypothetical protein
MNGSQLHDAGFAPSGPERNDHGFSIVLKGGRIDGGAFQRLNVGCWNSAVLLREQRKCDQKKKIDDGFHINRRYKK